MTTVRLATAVLVVAGSLLAGPAGLLTGLTIAALVELAGLRLAVAGRDRPPALPGAGSPGPLAAEQDLPSYRRIYNEVSRGQHSGWEYGHGLGRRLRRVAAVRLVDRVGIDIDQHPDRARDVLGPDSWRLVATPRSARRGSDGPGIGRAELSRLLDRLEEL